MGASPYFGCHRLETVNDYTFYLFSLGSQPREEKSSRIFPFSARLIPIVFEDFENLHVLGLLKPAWSCARSPACRAGLV